MNGKGDKPRPFSVSYEKYAENFDRIFNKKKNKKDNEELNGFYTEKIDKETIKLLKSYAKD